MTRDEPNITRDGYVSFLGGVDYSTAPNLLGPDVLAGGYNVTVRNGFADQRPPFNIQRLSFPSDELEAWFKTHIIQGYGEYDPFSADPYFLVASGGRILKIEPWNGFMVSEVTPTKTAKTVGAFISPPTGTSTSVNVPSDGVLVGYPVTIGDGSYMVTATASGTITVTNVDATPGVNIVVNSDVVYLDPNGTLRKRAWFEQAEKYMFIQDGQNACIIYDGAKARRSIGITGDKPEIPTGTVMVYSQKRLYLARGGNQIEIGDIAGGPTEVFNWTEQQFLAEGGKFSVQGVITAMREISNLDTSLGQGPVVVFTRAAAYSLNLPATRTLWKDLNYPIQTVSVKNSGATAQYSTTIVNSDVFYRSPDNGLRTYYAARRDFGGWSNIPISSEMGAILDEDTNELLEFGSAILFDNRLLFTLDPLPINSNAAYHRGIGVMDFDLITSLRQRSPPVFDPVWSGIRVIMLCSLHGMREERAFAFVHNDAGEVEFWEIAKDGDYDSGSTRIISVLETRSFTFSGNSVALDLMSLVRMAIWIDNLKGQVDFEVEWRPDQYPCWFPWHEWSVCQKTNDCGIEAVICDPNIPLQPGYRTRLQLPSPPTSCNTTDKRPAHLGYEFQVRIKWTGRCRIKKILVKAKKEQESPYEATTC